LIGNKSVTSTGQMFRVHSPGGNTFLCEMMSWSPSWNYNFKSKILLCQSLRMYTVSQKRKPPNF